MERLARAHTPRLKVRWHLNVSRRDSVAKQAKLRGLPSGALMGSINQPAVSCKLSIHRPVLKALRTGVSDFSPKEIVGIKVCPDGTLRIVVVP